MALPGKQESVPVGMSGIRPGSDRCNVETLITFPSSMYPKKMEVHPSPRAPDLTGNAELELLAKWLEESLAKIDDKLERLLRTSYNLGGMRHAASRRAFDIGDRQPTLRGQAPTSSQLREGWLEVQASGGASSRTWEQDLEPTIALDSISKKMAEEQHEAFPETCDRLGSANECASWSSDLDSSMEQPEASLGNDPVSRRPSAKSSKSSGGSVVLSHRIMNFISSRSTMPLSEKVWMALQDPDLNTCSYLYELLVRTLIVLSVTTTLLQTLPDPLMNKKVSAIVETSLEVFFLGEVTVRFTTSPNRQIFWRSTYNWIDLVSGAFVLLRASLGFTISEPNSSQIVCSILVGFCPVIRFLKLLRRMRQVHLLYKAFILAYQALQPLLSMYFFLLLLFTGIVWVVEPRSNLADFPDAAWFTFVSMTTIGYGDVTPDTAAGAVVVALGTLSAMLYMAIPLGIIGSAFNDVWKNRDKLLIMERARDRLLTAGYRPSDLPELFELFDANEDGQLDKDEFNWLLHGLKLGLSRSNRDELFKVFDHNRSGGVNHKEFVSSLFPQSVENVYGRPSASSASTDDTDIIQQQMKMKIHTSRREGGQSAREKRKMEERQRQENSGCIGAVGSIDVVEESDQQETHHTSSML